METADINYPQNIRETDNNKHQRGCALVGQWSNMAD